MNAPLPLFGVIAFVLGYAILRIESNGNNGGSMFWLEIMMLGAAFLLMRPASGRPLCHRHFQRFTARRAVVLAIVAPLVVSLFLRAMAFYSGALAQATNGGE